MNPFAYIEFGPVVLCTDAGELSDTRRTTPGGAWACLNCGSTEHQAVV